MKYGISIDDVVYSVVTGIQRVAKVTPSQISGMLLDKTYFNDVIGTYMEYTITIAVPYGKEQEYSQLYEILTNPVADHRIILPYNQTTIEIVGRIETVSDSYFRQENRNGELVNIWRSITFDITANHPTKEMSLEEVLERGVSPYPLVSELDAGMIYYYNNDGEWVTTTLVRADDIYY